VGEREEALANLGQRTAEQVRLLIDDLRRAGYLIGVDQYRAAADLLLALASAGQFPDDFRRLGPLLGPILCHSPKEQDDFRQRFLRWSATVDAPEAPLPGPAPPLSLASRPGPPDVLESALHRVNGGAQSWLAYIALGSLLFAVALLVTFVSLPTVSVFRDKPKPPSKIANGSGIDPTGRARQAPEIISGPVPPEQTPGQPEPAIPVVVLLSGVVLLAAVRVLWGRWLRDQARSFVGSVQRPASNEVEQLLVAATKPELFGTLTLAHSTKDLRRRRQVATHTLDIPATLAATVRRGGWFSPVAGRRQVVPEYLVLVDRQGPRDQQARFFDTLVDCLTENGLFVCRYHFVGDPRRCEPDERGTDPVGLRDLAARHPDHRLLVFSDGAGMINPVTGEAVSWLDQLSAWPERALLSPEPARDWGEREQTLEQNGLMVVSATEAGLALLTQRLESESPGPVPTDKCSPFPALLRHRPQRWLRHREPEPAELKDLLTSLRHYLGDEGYYWLSACAVYPVLDWHLTVHLGSNLVANGVPLLDQPRLQSLLRLPWFRYGALPEWLRQALLADLTGPREDAVREVLAALLLTALTNPLRSVSLEIRRPASTVLTALASRVLRALAQSAPDASLLRDAVFAQFMAGGKPGNLLLRFPREVLRHLQGTPPSTANRKSWAVALELLAGLVLLGFLAGRSLLTPAREAPSPRETESTFVAPDDSFLGVSRWGPKTRIVEEKVEDFPTVAALVNHLLAKNPDEQMASMGITRDTNTRVGAEKRNVRVTGYIYALKKEADNDYHVIIGDSPAADSPVFLTTEVSGIPNGGTDANRKRLVAARDQFKQVFNLGPVGPNSYNRLDKPARVRITGSLFWDVDHRPGAVGPVDLKPKTSWEIHPVSAIEFLHEGS
jgi:hypothetical protein